MRTLAPRYPDLEVEKPFWESGVLNLAGLDEAGRGAWAGPVTAAAVILPPGGPSALLQGVRDSKQMTARQRAAKAHEIKTAALAWGVSMASEQEIDAQGIIAATRLAMQRALQGLAAAPQRLLIDALRLPDVALPQTVLVKGDARCLSIAAASVLAKTARDEWMLAAAQRYPAYGFERHKGYGTAAHRAALQTYGPCSLHRFSFAPLKDSTVFSNLLDRF